MTRQVSKQKTKHSTVSKELIKIEKQTIGNDEINSVDARELWRFLKSKQHYSDWIKKRIKEYNFVQGIDFITNQNKMFSPPRKEYTISVDMAKELSMVEKNQKGKEARQYFIQCEKESRSPLNYIDALKQLIIAEEQKLIAEKLHKETVKELEYKEEVISGICKSISLETQRQVLNKVVRYKGSDFRERWRLLYDHFSRKYHMNLAMRKVKYDALQPKGFKTKNTLDFIENGLEMLPELYEIALKLYEADINEIIDHYKDIY